MKPRAHLQQAGHAPGDCHLADRRFRNPGQDFEQCGFPGAIAADDSDSIALLDIEADIPERPEFFASRILLARYARLAERPRGTLDTACDDIPQRRVALRGLMTEDVLLSEM